MKKWIVIAIGGLATALLLSLVCASDNHLPAGETVGQWWWFDRSALCAAMCIIVGTVLFRKTACPDFSVAVSWSLIGWAVVQTLMGLRQLYGFSASGHALYALTGSFFNPGPYSGYLGMVLPICLHEYLRLKAPVRYVAGGAALLMLCVLPAAMSRSAWLAAGVSCLWVYGCHAGWGQRLQQAWQTKRNKVLAVAGISICVVCLAGAGLFWLKPDSARGRLFMWRMTGRAICEKPWTGHGTGNFAAAYGKAQETYFAAGDYEAWEERVAGSPEYAFNEYLQATVEYGIPTTLLLLAGVTVCWQAGRKKKRYGCCGALLSLGIFAFSSYPLQLPVFVVTGCCLLAASVTGNSRKGWIAVAVLAGGIGIEQFAADREAVKACKEWMNARLLYQNGAYDSAEKAYRQLYPVLKDRAAFLFEYGHGLHRQEKYSESNQILEEAALHSFDPMIWNIMGKNYQALGDGTRAETYFLHAVHLLPGRIYPYYLLAKLYASATYRNPEKLKEMKHIVLTKEPKVNSTAIRQMREEVNRLE